MSSAVTSSSSKLSEGFWAAAQKGVLVVQKCSLCGRLRHYPQLRCAQCLSGNWYWAEMSGSGVIYSFTVTYQAFDADWSNRVPYVVATVELAEGVRMVTDLEEPVEEIAIGAPVEVVFDRHADGKTLPRFRMRQESTSHTRDLAGVIQHSNSRDRSG